MTPSRSESREELLLVHAPVGRDARLLSELFERAGLRSLVCARVDDLCREIEAGAGAVVVAEEGLDRASIQKLKEALEKQEYWSDLPLLVLTIRGTPTATSRQRLATLEPLGELTLLERPLRSETILSAARSALRARAKQHEVRQRDLALREAQVRLEAVIEQMPAGLFLVDAGSGRVLIHNQEAARILGGPRAPRFPEDPLSGAMREDGRRYRPEEYPTARALMRGEVVRQEVMPYDRADGKRVYLSVNAAPVTDQGRTVAAVCNIQDVTAQKQAEERQAYLLALSDAIRPLHEAEAVKAAACRVLGERLRVNRAFYAEVLGDDWVVEGGYGRNGKPLAPGRYSATTYGGRIMKTYRAGRKIVLRDTRIDPGFSPEERAAHIAIDILGAVGVPLVKEGTLVAILAVHTEVPREWTDEDIALVEETAERTWAAVERASAEAAVRATAEHLRLSLQAGHSGTFDWESRTNINVWSEELLALYGLKAKEFSGRYEDWQERVLPEDWEQADGAVQRSLEQGEFSVEFRIRRKDNGAIRWMHARGQAQFDAEGRAERLVGINVDITDRKEAQEALRRSNDELVRMNRELEEFAYVASHDMQEPLRMVNIYTQLILKRLDGDATLDEYAGVIRQGVKRMETLIHDLLTYSRVVQREEVPSGHANLAAALEEARSVLDSRIVESGAVIQAEALPVTFGDTEQMAHVFQNLFSNALKYRNPDRSPEIRVGAVRKGEYWTISVEDNGIGFDQQYAQRIFGLFKRLHKAEYPGTGLGLSICQRIVERYGGRMWAEGRPGEGATFYFELRAADGS